MCANALGDLTLTDNTISNNTSVTSFGGVAVYSGGSVIIKNNTVNRNKTGSDGGVVRVSSSGKTTIVNNTVNDNYGYGSAICFSQYSGDVTLSGNTIQNNQTSGIYYADPSYCNTSPKSSEYKIFGVN